MVIEILEEGNVTPLHIIDMLLITPPPFPDWIKIWTYRKIRSLLLPN